MSIDSALPHIRRVIADTSAPETPFSNELWALYEALAVELENPTPAPGQCRDLAHSLGEISRQDTDAWNHRVSTMLGGRP